MMLGYQVLRVMPKQVISGEAINWLQTLMEKAKNER